MRIMQKGKREKKKPRYKAGRAGFLRRVRGFPVRRMRRELSRLREPPASPDRDCTTPRRTFSCTAGFPDIFPLVGEQVCARARATLTNRRYQSGPPLGIRDPGRETREDFVTMARLGPPKPLLEDTGSASSSSQSPARQYARDSAGDREGHLGYGSRRHFHGEADERTQQGIGGRAVSLI
jgi:hypothetical protein